MTIIIYKTGGSSIVYIGTFTEDREKARDLRRQGLSLNQITKQVGHCKNSIRAWVKDIILDEEQKRILENRKQPHRDRKREFLNSIGYKKQTTIIDKNYNPKEIGEQSVAQIMAQLISAGKTVLVPFGDSKRYDLVVEENEKFYRIQCKTAQFKGDHIVFRCLSNNWNSGKRRNYLGEADLFAAYFREQNIVYIIDVNSAPKTECHLRLVPPFGKSAKPPRMADNYKFIPSKPMKEYLNQNIVNEILVPPLGVAPRPTG